MEILFLAHRIPYPPNKGDKIRSFHWLRELAARHTVHLGTFVDDPSDWPHRDTLAAYCDRQCYRALHPRRARLRSARALIDGDPLGFAYYRDPAMQHFVDRVLAERPIDAVLVFSSTMAPYVVGHDPVRRILDFVDVDSDKWAQYAAAGGRGPMRWVYAREARTLARAEQALAAVFDASVFVSPAEAAFFSGKARGVAERIHAIGNGVDAQYFDPGAIHSEDDDARRSRLVFTGAMDYGANVDAVCWFVAAVWPLIRAERPDVVLDIVGARPSRRVLGLGAADGVSVTGTVEDVRPYLARAGVAIAPMRIARGIQNKVLEALAMACPVVMTPQAAEGLTDLPAEACDVADTPEDFAARVLARLAPTRAMRCQAGRDYVLAEYGWSAQAGRIEALLAGRSETGQDHSA